MAGRCRLERSHGQSSGVPLPSPVPVLSAGRSRSPVRCRSVGIWRAQVVAHPRGRRVGARYGGDRGTHVHMLGAHPSRAALVRQRVAESRAPHNRLRAVPDRPASDLPGRHRGVGRDSGPAWHRTGVARHGGDDARVVHQGADGGALSAGRARSGGLRSVCSTRTNARAVLSLPSLSIGDRHRFPDRRPRVFDTLPFLPWLRAEAVCAFRGNRPCRYASSPPWP
jgi:hypothetical protein